MKPFYQLSDFPDRKSAGKNFIAECPKCGKKHLSIAKANGMFYCFYAGCGFHGQLLDFQKQHPLNHSYSAPAAGYARSHNTAARTPNDDGTPQPPEVPMIPEDYTRLTSEIMKRIQPLDADPQNTDPVQQAARRYLADQGISPATAIAARLGCLKHHCAGKGDKNTSGMVHTCIAYVNYLNGQPINAKYRSCDPSNPQPSPQEEETEKPVYTKCWSQDSPTTPCAPYNIDCINPLLVTTEENIQRLIITEGEKDTLSLLEAGYQYVISMPNGAASEPAKAFEAFTPWLNQVDEIVICGDTDLPGRTLVKHLSDYFGTRSLHVVLPGDCKDISDVLAAYGAEVVRQIIDSAYSVRASDIITVHERETEIMNVLHGEFDHGYQVGHGPLTDHVLHPTDQGGLIIATGKANAGKTDFMNDLTCRLMAKTGRHVCYLSFEVPDKNKHIAHLVHLMLGKANTTHYTSEQLRPLVNYLDAHTVHLDFHEAPPTPDNIIARAEQVRKKMPLEYLYIDPYLFMEMNTAQGTTETQAIKSMLTQMQTWGRNNKIWVIIVAHPRKLAKLTGKNELEEIDMYTIAGSANWANLADFIFSISRINEPDRAFTRLDMLKVRDQDLCQTGTVLYVRQPCGRYDERESEEQIMAEMNGRMMAHDQAPWTDLLAR